MAEVTGSKDEMISTIKKELEQRFEFLTQNDPTVQRLQGMLDVLEDRVQLNKKEEVDDSHEI
tara:strand:- start:304 stop:489 length:186 start_codon:yes stop_codon:yes gene_type:complete